MNKKLTKEQLQDIKTIINSSRSKGMSDQEIYNELRYRYRYDEKRKIYNLITGTATEELKNKYRILNYILVIILVISLLSRLLFMLGLYLSGETNLVSSLILGLLLACFPIFFIIEVVRYNGCVYKLLGWLSVSGCLKYLGYVLKHITHVRAIDLLDDIFSMIISISGAIISFYIAKKVFPNFKIFAPKDRQGDYIITKE
jgi:hypothetical protein